MIISYFRIAWRNLSRNKVFTFINMLGLAIGLAASILILIYIDHELSYDKFFKDSNRIFRVAVDGRMSGDFFNVAVTPAPMAPALKAEFPEVEMAVRIRNEERESLLAYDVKKFYVADLIFADTAFFEIFNFEPIEGDLETALLEPLSIVLTSSMAKKFFGDEAAYGKVLRINDSYNLKVTAVINDLPSNTHFNCPAIISWSSLDQLEPKGHHNNWGSLGFYTYLKLAENTDIENFNQKIEKFIIRKIMVDSGESPEVFENFQMEFNAYLQPVVDIHLHSNLMAEMSPNSDISYVYTFSAIAFFILLIACINFMNLTTARSARRAKEVGIRKVHGAFRKQLVYQFISESVLLSLITLVIALLLVEILLPVFSEIIGSELNQSILVKPMMILQYAVLAVLVGIVAGSYPAFYLSAFQPAKVLKGAKSNGGSRTSILRNALVVFQFAISIFLIIGTGIISKQIDYVQNKRLGFDKERVMMVELRNNRLRENSKFIKEQLKGLAVVENVSVSSLSPGQGTDGTAYFPEGMNENDPWLIFHAGADYDYIETLGMKMIRGRNFSIDYASDTAAIIINKTLWEKLGWGEEAIGKKMKQGDPMNGRSYHVIGVVDDFHFESLHDKIEPFIFYLQDGETRNLCLRLKEGDIKNQVAAVQEAWTIMEPDFPFVYRFLDQSFGELYNAELRLSKIFIYFTIIAIFIACLGLFGLASYMAEQRTKEIGIRKTFGASTGRLVLKLTADFTKWILLANVIAWPAAYFILDNWWLSEFAFRIRLIEHWDVFVYSALVSFVIAVVTVSFQAFRAATINPAVSLKYE